MFASVVRPYSSTTTPSLRRGAGGLGKFRVRDDRRCRSPPRPRGARFRRQACTPVTRRSPWIRATAAAEARHAAARGCSRSTAPRCRAAATRSSRRGCALDHGDDEAALRAPLEATSRPMKPPPITTSRPARLQLRREARGSRRSCAGNARRAIVRRAGQRPHAASGAQEQLVVGHPLAARQDDRAALLARSPRRASELAARCPARHTSRAGGPQHVARRLSPCRAGRPSTARALVGGSGSSPISTTRACETAGAQRLGGACRPPVRRRR